MLEIKEFVEKFAAQFDETDASEFRPETRFLDLADWSSLKALFVIAMVDEEYQVKLQGDDIRNAQTIEDIFAIVQSKA
jgi:acyl carrier protein